MQSTAEGDHDTSEDLRISGIFQRKETYYIYTLGRIRAVCSVMLEVIYALIKTVIQAILFYYSHINFAYGGRQEKTGARMLFRAQTPESKCFQAS